MTPENEMQPKNPLRYHETLDAFKDTVSRHYSEKDAYVFRTVMSDPPTDRDLTPRKFRDLEPADVQELLIEYTEEEVAELSEKEILEEVGHNALSVNSTPEKCRKEAIRAYRGVKKKYSSEIADDFKKSRGPVIAKFHITPESGVISDFNKNGHANYLVREGVTITDVWVSDYPLEEIDYDG